MFSRRQLCWAGLSLLAGLSMAPLAASWLWFLGLIDHFRPFLALASFGLALLSWRQSRWLTGGGAGLMLLNLLIVGSGWARPLPPAPESGPTLALMHLNVDRHNADLAPALAYISVQKPDILFLQEVTPDNLALVIAGLATYQLVLAEPRADSRGSALLATPAVASALTAEVIVLPAAPERPLLQARLQLPDQTITLLSFHATRPRSYWTAQSQAAELAGLADWSRAQQANGTAVLIVGDFNATPWSAGARALRQAGGLHLAGTSLGRWATWPDALPFLPLDLALGSEGIRFVGYERGPAVGSDHRPVLFRWQMDPSLGVVGLAALEMLCLRAEAPSKGAGDAVLCPSGHIPTISTALSTPPK